VDVAVRPRAGALAAHGMALVLSLFGGPPVLAVGLAAVGAVFAGRGLLSERRAAVEVHELVDVAVGLLRGDLRAAALALCLLVGAALVRRLMAPPRPQQLPVSRRRHRALRPVIALA
jgi:hypothetical protein